MNPFETEKIRLAVKHLLESLLSECGHTQAAQAALLDQKGNLVGVQGVNPLHFAVFESCVKAAKGYVSLRPEDVLITNDPYSGNTRLCDLLFVRGAFLDGELRYYVALQISLPELLNRDWTKIPTSVEEEGFRIPPTPLGQNGSLNPALIDHICQSGISREQISGLMNKVKSILRNAGEKVIQLEKTSGKARFAGHLDDLNKYSESVMRKSLREIPDGEYTAFDFIDSDGVESENIRLQCKLSVQGENILLNFLGSSKQVRGPFNCNYSMTLAACFWVLRSFVKEDIPLNSGAFKTFSIEAPEETLVNPKYPSALLGGYFETSKRIVDVLYLALSKALPFEIPAHDGGSSAPLIFKFDKGLFLETLGSGSGASKNSAGVSAVRASLGNEAAQSIEEMEKTWPLQVIHCALRENSGGHGKNQGGEGISRGYQFLQSGRMLLLCDRRRSKPHGLYGGTSGLPTETVLTKKGDKKKTWDEKGIVDFSPNDTLIVNTPGGGGWGKVDPTPEQ